MGFTEPIVADVHFNPKVAEEWAKFVEKVRIIPGNYVDKKQKFDFRAAMIESGYDATLVDEWLTVRKIKRLSNTQTAFEHFTTEANKVKVDKNTLLKMIVAQSWGGFKAAWYANEKKANTGATALLDNVDYTVKF